MLLSRPDRLPIALRLFFTLFEDMDAATLT
jgi:hypothetical protein